MAIEGQIQALLGALVSGRCYPVINTSTDIVSPYITFQVIATNPDVVLDGPNGLENRMIQIDIWAENYTTSKSLEAQVKTAMKAASFSNIPIGYRDLYEEASREYRVLMEYSVWS